MYRQRAQSAVGSAWLSNADSSDRHGDADEMLCASKAGTGTAHAAGALFSITSIASSMMPSGPLAAES